MFATVMMSKPVAREIEELDDLDAHSFTAFIDEGSVVILTDTLDALADFLHISVTDIEVVE